MSIWDFYRKWKSTAIRSRFLLRVANICNARSDFFVPVFACARARTHTHTHTQSARDNKGLWYEFTLRPALKIHYLFYVVLPQVDLQCFSGTSVNHFITTFPFHSFSITLFYPSPRFLATFTRCDGFLPLSVACTTQRTQGSWQQKTTCFSTKSCGSLSMW